MYMDNMIKLISILALVSLACGNNLSVQGIGQLRGLAHEVSGKVTILDTRRVKIENFTYDGQGPAAFFWVGNSSDRPSANGWKIANENGSFDEPLGRYISKTVVLTIPEYFSFKNLKWLSVWCELFAVDFGYVMIPPGLSVPPYSGVGIATMLPEIVVPTEVVTPDPEVVTPEPEAEVSSPEPEVVTPEPEVASPEPDIVLETTTNPSLRNITADPIMGCTGGKVFKECGSACPRTCNKPFTLLCTMQCVRGCQCPRYLVDNNGICVRFWTCLAKPRPVCRGGKIFNKCGSDCPASCQNRYPRCTKRCVPRCQCPRRSVESGDRCVRPWQCPKSYRLRCTGGRYYRTCGPCRRTCTNRTGRCYPWKCVKGCHCPRGTVEGTVQGRFRCVSFSRCNRRSWWL